MSIIYIFIIGFVLGLAYSLIGENLPVKVDKDIEIKPSSWIMNLFIGIISGSLTIISYYFYGISFNFFLSLIVIALLVIIYISDFKYMIILDSPLVIGCLLTLLLRYIYFDIKNVGISLLSGIILFAMMLIIGFIGKKAFKKEALGGGDIKLAFVIGIILNLRLGLMSIIISSLLAMPYALGSLMLSKNREVPYGPFLVGSMTLIFIFSEKFLNLLNFLG